MSLATVAAGAVVVATGVAATAAFNSLTSERGRTLASLKVVPEEVRTAFPENFYPGGAYAELTFGEVHYNIFGPEEGKKLVLIHGLSTPSSVYNRVARTMAEHGHRIMLFDLYSRGYSVGPANPHTPDFYVEQLHSLMKHIGWKKANFVGLSLGGAILASYAYRFPETVESVTFLAPGGLLRSTEVPLVGHVLRNMPFTEELSSPKAAKRFLAKRNAASMMYEFHGYTIPTAIEHCALILELQSQHHAGYVRGIISTLRNFPLTGLQKQFESLAHQSFKCQVMWGTRDTVVPYSSIETIQKLIPDIKVVKIEGATHSLTMTHHEDITRELRRFLQ